MKIEWVCGICLVLGICVFGLFISFMPFVSVWRDVFVSWFMRVISPWSSVFASIARYLLRWYSFSVGSIVSMRVLVRLCLENFSYSLMSHAI
jgi:hypothetical protein